MHPRTLPDLPLAPFAPLARKKWFTKMEKKPRVEIIDDNPPGFLKDDLSMDDFEMLSMDGLTPRSGKASTRSKSEANDMKNKGEDWKEIEKEEVMSKLTARTVQSSPSKGGGSTGAGSKSKRRGSKTGSGSNSRSYTHRTKASMFSKAYSEAMSDAGESDVPDEEVQLSRQQELFLLYQELMEDTELGFWEVVSEVGYINYFLFWRRGLRLKRMHHIYLEYEKKVKLYNDRLREEIKKEQGQDELALIALMARQDAIRKKYNLTQRNRRLVEIKMEKSLIKYEKKAALVQYYCDHLHDWAIEKHDEKVAQKKAEEEEAERKRKQAELDRIEANRIRRIRRELEILEEDRICTQGVKSIMRRAGKIESVNVQDLGVVMKPQATKVENEVVELFLKDNVNFKGFKKNGRFVLPSEMEGGGGGDHFNPFNLDLTSNSSRVMVLQCYGLGERGVMCLAADFIRGACPYLEVLNLAHCEITTRGFSKLLSGLKTAKLKSITALDLRGNHLTPRALEHLREALANGVFENLTAIDLRENELGDEGAIAISRMLVSGALETIQDLHLQHNNITDTGFLSLAKLLVHLWRQKAPNLERIGMESNKITPEAKRSIDPLPLFFSM